MSEGGGDFSVPAAFVPGKRRIAKPPGGMPGGFFDVWGQCMAAAHFSARARMSR